MRGGAVLVLLLTATLGACHARLILQSASRPAPPPLLAEASCPGTNGTTANCTEAAPAPAPEGPPPAEQAPSGDGFPYGRAAVPQILPGPASATPSPAAGSPGQQPPADAASPGGGGADGGQPAPASSRNWVAGLVGAALATLAALAGVAGVYKVMRRRERHKHFRRIISSHLDYHGRRDSSDGSESDWKTGPGPDEAPYSSLELAHLRKLSEGLSHRGAAPDGLYSGSVDYAAHVPAGGGGGESVLQPRSSDGSGSGSGGWGGSLALPSAGGSAPSPLSAAGSFPVYPQLPPVHGLLSGQPELGGRGPAIADTAMEEAPLDPLDGLEAEPMDSEEPHAGREEDGPSPMDFDSVEGVVMGPNPWVGLVPAAAAAAAAPPPAGAPLQPRSSGPAGAPPAPGASAGAALQQEDSSTVPRPGGVTRPAGSSTSSSACGSASVGSGSFGSGAAHGGASKAGSGRLHSQQLSLDAPPGEGCCLINPEEITIAKRPDGSDWVLGEGAFGKVFKALKDGVSEVAVKVLTGPPSPAAAPADLEPEASHSSTGGGATGSGGDADFRRECAILRSCRDANVVQFLGACLQPGRPLMLVTELMEGGDLRQALSHWPDLFRWNGRGRGLALDVARGLHYLHRSSIIHFDLKSNNILLNRERSLAKITDVGLAISGHRYVSTAGLRGAFAWAAPEVLTGEARVSEKADIFSLGVVLWELVTGEAPRRGQMRNPRVPEDCPQAVDALIQRCMERDPRCRPSAKEVFLAIKATPATSALRPEPKQ